jgi:hypothetical protein
MQTEIQYAVLNDQGPTATVVNEADSRLFYKTFDNKLIPYLIEGEVRIMRNQTEHFEFTSFTYLTCTTPLTNITFNLPEGTLENAILEFTTGDTIEFTITGPNNYVINKPFEFEPNKRYIILVDVYTVLWSELQNINQ